MTSTPDSLTIGLGTLRRIWSHPQNRGRRGRRIAMWLGWQVFERTVRRPVTAHLPDGRRVRCHPHDPIASAVLYYGLADPEEMTLTRAYPRAGETFLDVGANIGIYSLLATAAPGVSAVAFEPAELAAGRLEENIALNHLSDRVQVDRRAVGAEVGRVVMTTELYAMNRVVSHASPGKENERLVEVPITSLDGWLSDQTEVRPSLVKIDVEGHELAVLEGARGLLAEYAPVLIIEVNDPSSLRDLLDELGYQPFSLDVGSGRIAPTTVAAHAGGNVMAARDLAAITTRLG